jgi:hypothetical protein
MAVTGEDEIMGGIIPRIAFGQVDWSGSVLFGIKPQLNGCILKLCPVGTDTGAQFGTGAELGIIQWGAIVCRFAPKESD